MTNNKRYRLLKPLPNIPIGGIFEWYGIGHYKSVTHSTTFLKEIVENFQDWFEEIVEPTPTSFEWTDELVSNYGWQLYCEFKSSKPFSSASFMEEFKRIKSPLSQSIPAGTGKANDVHSSVGVDVPLPLKDYNIAANETINEEENYEAFGRKWVHGHWEEPSTPTANDVSNGDETVEGTIAKMRSWKDFVKIGEHHIPNPVLERNQDKKERIVVSAFCPHMNLTKYERTNIYQFNSTSPIDYKKFSEIKQAIEQVLNDDHIENKEERWDLKWENGTPVIIKNPHGKWLLVEYDKHKINE